MSYGQSRILPFPRVAVGASSPRTDGAGKDADWPTQFSALALFRQNAALRAQNAALKQALQDEARTRHMRLLIPQAKAGDLSADVLRMPPLRGAMSGPATAIMLRQCLTQRQREILALVLAGCPSKNIAADLGISQRTVENHRAAIMRRTGATSIPALTRLMIGVAQIGDCKGTIPHRGPQPAATRKALLARE